MLLSHPHQQAGLSAEKIASSYLLLVQQLFQLFELKLCLGDAVAALDFKDVALFAFKPHQVNLAHKASFPRINGYSFEHNVIVSPDAPRQHLQIVVVFAEFGFCYFQHLQDISNYAYSGSFPI